MERKMPTHLNWILRGAVVLGGLSLAACAPLAVPGEASANQPASNSAVADVALQNGADDTATPGSTSTAASTATDDSVTPEATSTALPTSTANIPDASQTPAPGMTVTAVAGQEVEFIGTIESFDNGVLMVSGRKVVITAQTEVKFQPQKGLNVKVHGTVQADGSVLAREISSVPDGQATHMPDMSRTPGPKPTHEQRATREANEREFTGTVSSINGNVFVVDGVTVVVAGEIKGTIVVGDVVKVHGVTQADGSVLAREIEKADADDDGDDDNGDDGDGHGGHGSDDATPVGGDDHGGDRGGHGRDDMTATPMPTSVSDDSATPAPTAAPTDDHGGHGDDDNGSDDHGGHGGDDNGGDDHGGHGNP